MICFPLLSPELPRSEVAEDMHAKHYLPLPSVSCNGFLFKIGSMARAITERRVKEGMMYDMMHLSPQD